MKITFDIPDEKAERIIAGFCITEGYQATITDLVSDTASANPETPEKFVKRRLKEHLLVTAKAGEVRLTTEAAHKAAIEKADAELVI